MISQTAKGRREEILKKLASGNRGSVDKDEMDKEDPTQGIPDWLQPFTDNLEDLETHVPAHSSEREISDSEGDASKVETEKTDAQCLFSLHQRPKLRLLLVLTEGSESRNNHRYAVVVQDLATQWIQSYPCRNKNFSGNPEESTKVSRAVTEAKSYIFGQFIGIWQIL